MKLDVYLKSPSEWGKHILEIVLTSPGSPPGHEFFNFRLVDKTFHHFFIGKGLASSNTILNHYPDYGLVCLRIVMFSADYGLDS